MKIQKMEETDNSFWTKSAYGRKDAEEEKGKLKDKKKDKRQKYKTQSRPKFSPKLEFG